MKALRLGIFALLVLLCASVAAQDTAKSGRAQKTPQSRQTRTVRVRGNISADGTRFVEAVNQKIWLIKNVDMCKGYEGQQAIVRGQIAPETSVIQVISISAQPTYSASWSDSAFRR